MTLQAASCWYKAWESSLRVACDCFRVAWDSTTRSSHSFWNLCGNHTISERYTRPRRASSIQIEGRLKFACLTGWNIASIAGKDVADSGLGRWARSQATGNKSSGFNSSPVTGHRFSEAWSAFSMSRLSKRWPDFRLTTGCWGTSPEMAQYILALVS